MYRSRPGHSPIGGKMLKFLSIFLISFPAIACLGVNLDGKLAVDGQTWKMNQTLTFGREHAFRMGPYILSLTVTHSKTDFLVKYKVEEKLKNKLILITHGEEGEIDLNSSRDIMAKGLEGQPNSIITLQLRDI